MPHPPVEGALGTRASRRERPLAGGRMHRTPKFVDPHLIEKGGDGIVPFGSPNELESDSDISLEGRCRIPYLAVQSDGDGVVSGDGVHGDSPSDQIPGLRMMERDAEAKHRDVDDLAVSPPPRFLALDVAEASQACGLARGTRRRYSIVIPPPTRLGCLLRTPTRLGALGGTTGTTSPCDCPVTALRGLWTCCPGAAQRWTDTSKEAAASVRRAEYRADHSTRLRTT